jgi:Acyl-CoA carboxylase epsilon subunit
MTTTPQRPAGAASWLRVERGSADPEELAAVSVVLLARAGSTGGGLPRRTGVNWRQADHRQAFCAPHSWQSPP